jgi:hypothetical protein
VKPLRVIAIDPGERTGWATGTVRSEPGDEPDISDLNQGVHPLRDFALGLHKNAHKYDVIAYETWRLYPGMAKRMIGNDMQPSQLVGIIRLQGWLHPNVQLVSLGATVKQIADKTMPDWLRDRKEQSSEEHDKDALDLLWYFAWRRALPEVD